MRTFLFSIFLLVCVSCGSRNELALLSHSIKSDSLLANSNYGIKIYDLDNKKSLIEYNANNLFIPASNTKLLTMYTILHQFKDSIPGWRINFQTDTLFIEPLGDPTFLNKEFSNQYIFEFLLKDERPCVLIAEDNRRVPRFGSGWSWGTWQEVYSPERSIMPIYGNLVQFYKSGNKMYANPSYFNENIIQLPQNISPTSVIRDEIKNTFQVRKSSNNKNSWERPFTYLNSDTLLSFKLLKDTLQKINAEKSVNYFNSIPEGLILQNVFTINRDSILSKMMKNSDNFLAEQLLILASRNKYGYFDDAQIRKYIQDSILNDILKDCKWVDGSGLGRGNMISPNSFVKLLEKFYETDNAFLVKKILPRGGEGTLKGLYVGYENNIWAKTGTLADHLGLSGYLLTKKQRNLAFSILINNKVGNINSFRKKIESILIDYIERY